MSLPLVFRPEVQGEIDAIYAWYEQQRVGLGERFLSRLRELLDRITDSPHLYGAVRRNARACPVQGFPYVVYYQDKADHTLVLAVLHGKRKSQHWRSRLS